MTRYGILILSMSLAFAACGRSAQVAPTAPNRAAASHFPFASLRASQSNPNAMDLLDINGAIVGTTVNEGNGTTIQFKGRTPLHFVYASTGGAGSNGAVAYVRGGLAIRVQPLGDSLAFTMAGRGGDGRSIRTATVAQQRQSAAGTRRAQCFGSTTTMYLAALTSAAVFDMMDLLGLDYASLATDASNPNAIAVTLDGTTQYWDNLVLGLALSDLAGTNPDAYNAVWDDVNRFLTYGDLVAGELTDKHCLATDT